MYSKHVFLNYYSKNNTHGIFFFFQCGACWAFSIVSGIESAYAIKRNTLEKLSVQQVIDCSYNNYGCNGGSTISALSWLNEVFI